MGVSLPVAFAAGLVSFLSPCVLPLIPAYLAYLAGHGLADAPRGAGGSPRSLLLLGAAFVLGFTLVFIALGATAGGIGSLLKDHLPLLRRLGGAVVILFGLHMAGILRLFILDGERRLQPPPPDGSLWRALVLGATFGAGWTPCIGPVLASVLVLAGSRASVHEGIGLLAAYGGGLAVPFLLLTIFLDRLEGVLKRLLPYAARIRMAGGLLLSGLGVMIYTNTFVWLNSVFRWTLPF